MHIKKQITSLRLPYGAGFAIFVLLLLSTSPGALAQNQSATGDWIQLFNGTNLDGWTAHVAKHGYDNNYGDTFRVEDGKIVVSYDHYSAYDGQTGHLFYKNKYSHYVLEVEYRFVGEQVKGGPGWARRNSGIMIHCQDPKTMKKNEQYPASLEAQLLGGFKKGKRTTANLCTPGTNVVRDGQVTKQHCINSSSKTYRGNQWVSVRIEVQGNKQVQHFVEGNLVFEYTKPQLEETETELIERYGGKLISDGYIALQSESHPIEFRNIRLKPLDE